MEEIVGKVVDLEEGDTVILENTIAYKHVLDNAMNRIMKESKDCYVKEMALWDNLQSVAKRQHQDYNPDIHILSYNWPTRKLTIQTMEQKRKGLLA